MFVCCVVEENNTTLNSLQSLGESSGYESLKLKIEDDADKKDECSTSTPVWQISQVASEENNENEIEFLQNTFYENSSVGKYTDIYTHNINDMDLLFT